MAAFHRRSLATCVLIMHLSTACLGRFNEDGAAAPVTPRVGYNTIQPLCHGFASTRWLPRNDETLGKRRCASEPPERRQHGVVRPVAEVEGVRPFAEVGGVRGLSKVAERFDGLQGVQPRLRGGWGITPPGPTGFRKAGNPPGGGGGGGGGGDGGDGASGGAPAEKLKKPSPFERHHWNPLAWFAHTLR